MNKFPRYLFALMALFTGLNANAQQDAQFTQYMFNQMYFNSAFTGVEGGTTLTAIHRSQWFGYDGSLNQAGAPNTQVISYSSRLNNFNGGFGLYISNDNLGPSNNLELQASFARYFALPNGASLSVGVKAGFFSSALDFDELILVDPSDVVANLSGKESQLRPDLGVGILYRKGNFFGGLSANHLLEPEFDFGEDQLSNQLNRHYYLTAGYDYTITPQLTITPSILLKSVGFNTYNVDLSVIGKYNDKLWAGLAYRQSESASAMFGYKLLKDRSLTLAYAFDFVISDRDSKEPTSQELMLIYNFKRSGGGPARSIIRTPRYRY
ncbi:MAG: type IX secretion system membrane protein PorP/SprF [Roseivirga sp.]|nr:type IX secretion system membrane protein PorP/SprF [Roseivirga sp.]